MDLFWIAAIVVVIIVVVTIASKRKKESKRIRLFRRRDALFTAAERSFLGVLDQVSAGRYRVFGKVRIADVITPAKGLDKSTWTSVFNRIKAKHFEEGLLGLAFHPNYKENGEFFVYYSIEGPKEQAADAPFPLESYSIISRFKVSKDNPNRADPESEERLLKFGQPFGNHNGGSVEFGPDGMLYVGLGDGGKRDDPFNNAQNLKILLGSILRIDVDRKDPGKNYAIDRSSGLAAGFVTVSSCCYIAAQDKIVWIVIFVERVTTMTNKASESLTGGVCFVSVTRGTDLTSSDSCGWISL